MKIQTGTLKLMTWFLVGVLLALSVVGCESDSPDQTGPGESAQASAKEGIDSTPEIALQVTPILGEETAGPSVDSTPEITLQVTPTPGERTLEQVVASPPEPTPQVTPTPGERTLEQVVASPPEPTPQVSLTPGEETTGDYGDGRQESTTQVSSTMKEENVSTRRPTREEIRAATERAQAVRLKYEDLFSRQPNIWGVGIGRALHPNGEVSEEIGIVISVTKKVDQNTLPQEDRIPDRLEDIPVYLMEEPLPVLTPELPRVNPKEEESDGGR